MSIPIYYVGDVKVLTFDWSPLLPVGVTLTSCTHTVESPLVKGGEGSSTTTSSVTINASAAEHGTISMVTGRGTLSNSEIINPSFPVRILNKT